MSVSTEFKLEVVVETRDSTPEPLPEPVIESESMESLLLRSPLVDRFLETEEAVLEIDIGESIGGGVNGSDCKILDCSADAIMTLELNLNYIDEIKLEVCE